MIKRTETETSSLLIVCSSDVALRVLGVFPCTGEPPAAHLDYAF